MSPRAMLAMQAQAGPHVDDPVLVTALSGGALADRWPDMARNLGRIWRTASLVLGHPVLWVTDVGPLTSPRLPRRYGNPAWTTVGTYDYQSCRIGLLSEHLDVLDSLFRHERIGRWQKRRWQPDRAPSADVTTNALVTLLHEIIHAAGSGDRTRRLSHTAWSNATPGARLFADAVTELASWSVLWPFVHELSLPPPVTNLIDDAVLATSGYAKGAMLIHHLAIGLSDRGRASHGEVLALLVHSGGSPQGLATLLAHIVRQGGAPPPWDVAPALDAIYEPLAKLEGAHRAMGDAMSAIREPAQLANTMLRKLDAALAGRRPSPGPPLLIIPTLDSGVRRQHDRQSARTLG